MRDPDHKSQIDHQQAATNLKNLITSNRYVRVIIQQNQIPQEKDALKHLFRLNEALNLHTINIHQYPNKRAQLL